MVQPLCLSAILSHLSHSKRTYAHQAIPQIKPRTRIRKRWVLFHFFTTVYESLPMKASQTHLSNSTDLGYAVSA